MLFKIVVLTLAALILGVTADPPEEIVGGTRAKINEFPFLVSLRTISNSHFCGGSIISSRHILTAAHCVAYRNVNTFVAVIGTNSLLQGGDSYRISEARWPYRFNKQMATNYDIAVLTLSQSLTNSTPNWDIIKLASQDYTPGWDVTIAGFGDTVWRSRTPGSVNLLKVNLELAPLSKCQEFYRHLQLNDEHICILPIGSKSACNGDSGGPLTINGELAGLVSFGNICGYDPFVLTKVYKYREFVTSLVRLDLDRDVHSQPGTDKPVSADRRHNELTTPAPIYKPVVNGETDNKGPKISNPNVVTSGNKNMDYTQAQIDYLRRKVAEMQARNQLNLRI